LIAAIFAGVTGTQREAAPVIAGRARLVLHRGANFRPRGGLSVVELNLGDISRPNRSALQLDDNIEQQLFGFQVRPGRLGHEPRQDDFGLRHPRAVGIGVTGPTRQRLVEQRNERFAPPSTASRVARLAFLESVLHRRLAVADRVIQRVVIH
jgi:hypothetical protein